MYQTTQPLQGKAGVLQFPSALPGSPYLRCSSRAIAVCLRLPGAAVCQRQPSLCPCHQRCLHRRRAQVNAQHTGGPRRGHQGMAVTLTAQTGGTTPTKPSPTRAPGAALRARRDGAGARPGLRPQAEGASLPSALPGHSPSTVTVTIRPFPGGPALL